MSASVRFSSGQEEFGLARLSRRTISVSCHVERHETREFSLSVWRTHSDDRLLRAELVSRMIAEQCTSSEGRVRVQVGGRCGPRRYPPRNCTPAWVARFTYVREWTLDRFMNLLTFKVFIGRLLTPLSHQVSATKSLAADIPKHVLYFGLAGTLPYLGTSVTTVVLAREASRAASGMSRVLLGYGKAHADCLDGIRVDHLFRT